MIRKWCQPRESMIGKERNKAWSHKIIWNLGQPTQKRKEARPTCILGREIAKWDYIMGAFLKSLVSPHSLIECTQQPLALKRGPMLTSWPDRVPCIFSLFKLSPWRIIMLKEWRIAAFWLRVWTLTRTQRRTMDWRLIFWSSNLSTRQFKGTWETRLQDGSDERGSLETNNKMLNLT